MSICIYRYVYVSVLSYRQCCGYYIDILYVHTLLAVPDLKPLEGLKYDPGSLTPSEDPHLSPFWREPEVGDRARAVSVTCGSRLAGLLASLAILAVGHQRRLHALLADAVGQRPARIARPNFRLHVFFFFFFFLSEHVRASCQTNRMRAFGIKESQKQLGLTPPLPKIKKERCSCSCRKIPLL